jgi:hypothetical protein
LRAAFQAAQLIAIPRIESVRSSEETAMSEPTDGGNADEKTQALIGGDRLINRLRDEGVQGMKSDRHGDPSREARIDAESPPAVPDEPNAASAFGDIVEALETAPEVDPGRKALGEPPVGQTKAGPGLQAPSRQSLGPQRRAEEGAVIAGLAV